LLYFIFSIKNTINIKPALAFLLKTIYIFSLYLKR
jgi:hypothetical protein